MIGKLVDGRYRVLSILGSGGFGCTYLARDTRRPGEPTCVVKELSPASKDPSVLQVARRLFSCEASTLERLGNHDQIPRLLAYFEENEGFYLVQEFIDGVPLDVELQNSKPWQTSRVVSLLDQILWILDFVHGQRVIHRDVKPANIMRRSSDQKFVLLDFGAVKEIRHSKTTGDLTDPKTVAIGTTGYAPPEQLQGKPRASSDIYSLGVIAIQCLTGHSPDQFLEDELGEIDWQASHIPAELYILVRKMVKRNYRERYNTVSEVLQDLQPLLKLEQEKQEATTEIIFVESQTSVQPEVQPTVKVEEVEDSGKADILLVDDKPENLRLLSSMLEEQGYDVREAINGTLAIKAAQSLPPDLILLDINMPGLNGYEVCQRLKADQTTCDVPVIFVSAQDEAWDKVKAFSVGAVDYITKPFKVMEVLARIESHLKVGKLQKELYKVRAELKLEIQKRQQLELSLKDARQQIMRLSQAVIPTRTE